MTSFFAQSFEFFSDKPESVCAFLVITRPIFNSSVIPVTLNTTELWNVLSQRIDYHDDESHIVQPLLEVFLLSDTLQFSPSMRLGRCFLSESFVVHLLKTLIKERRYFCRTLKRFQSNYCGALQLVCDHVSSLEVLDYSSSGIFNWSAIARLTRLKELNLTGSRVDDEDLTQLAGLISLEKLILADTHITGNGFVHFSGMKSLRVLELFGLSNVSDAGLLYLPNLPSLVELSLTSNNSISEVVFSAAVKKQKNLRILNLSDCYQISSEGLKGLCELPELTDLDLSGCRRINDNSLSVLASIEGSLRRLSLAYCSLISNEGVTMLVNEMKDLVFLDLSGCSKITDTSLKAISNLKYLTELRISYLPLLSDEGIHFLKNCPQLSTIFLGGGIESKVSDLSLEAFSRMKSLTHLMLYNAKTFTDNGVAKLADSKSLERFELHGINDVTNHAMLSLSKSTALRKMKVHYGSRVTNEALRFFEGTKIHAEIGIVYEFH